MACRSAHLLGVRDGDAHSRLVCAGRDRLGAVAHGVRLAQLCRHFGRPDVWRRRRPYRSSRPAGDDARGLCRAGGFADDAGAVGSSHAADCLCHRSADGRRAAVGPRRARRAGCDHHAARSADRRDQPFPHHDGHRTHRRRAERRRIICFARDGAGLCGDRRPLSGRDRTDAVCGGAVQAASGRRHRRRGAAALPAARPEGGCRLCLDHAADARRALDCIPRQFDRVSADQRVAALYRANDLRHQSDRAWLSVGELCHRLAGRLDCTEPDRRHKGGAADDCLDFAVVRDAAAVRADADRADRDRMPGALQASRRAWP